MLANQLQLARALDLPSRTAMLNREHSVQQFWYNNDDLITEAWKEWEASEIDASTFTLDDSLLDKNLREAVKQTWEDPSKELAVKALLHEVAPDVFQFQFFDPERLAVLRGYLEQVWNSQIPMRPPYGIVLNRRGAILDSRSEGYLAAPSFQAFYNEILNTYMRPISRMLFPEVMGFDTQTFGFSIYYEPNTDSSIRPHTDASTVALNINLNLPGEEFTGSQVDFYHPYTGDIKSLTFKPGTAMLHRGNIAHAAKPITSGERTNFVLWLYGERGRLPAQGAPRIPVNAIQRWTNPNKPNDGYAPF
ncbi:MULTISPECIES: 2OG-Fe(II) oxygenase family protein [unclassified Pseudoalteromonas]|uniref:2OG-Fe(II) oxygenase family protein n=1 Tax=unclassified Pseudoalteromonas TaxID=194690 RepID=UPI0016010C1A|nr:MULTISPECIES: 2OG-Fe(II) oxygenase family protein [unclassified Pseudoalteromonas]MBB1350172.1 2OG-Fe(II) oxygenase [Pseudoalteromonas sp. SG45-3]MBB1356590.1 2OG-Fe(II) oxygenase [Pseudoalteromonas sp. SG45-6]